MTPYPPASTPLCTCYRSEPGSSWRISIYRDNNAPPGRGKVVVAEIRDNVAVGVSRFATLSLAIATARALGYPSTVMVDVTDSADALKT